MRPGTSISRSASLRFLRLLLCNPYESLGDALTYEGRNVLHLLEYRLTESGHPIAGFVLLVPHYLADTEFPSAAVTATTRPSGSCS